MQAGTAQVRTPCSLFTNCIAQSLELPASHVVEVGAIRTRCGGFVEVNRNAEAAPYLQPCLAREHYALFKLDAGDRYERNDIRCPDAGMQSLLGSQVDELDGLSHAAHSRFKHGVGFAGDGHNAAVVVGVL